MKPNIFIKLIVLSVILLVCAFFAKGHTAEIDGYVLNVKVGDSFAKENVYDIIGFTAVPFNTEYKLLLKNTNNHRCSARVFIDGAKVSPGGDFVINANSELLLERFVTDLNKGKRFKFVPLDNPAVDDPTRKENGLIRVEFRREVVPKYAIFINDKKIGEFRADDVFRISRNNREEIMRVSEIAARKYWNNNYIIPVGGTLTTTANDIYDSDKIYFGDDTYFEYDSVPTSSNGATISGSESTQSFHKVDYDFEEEYTEIRLMLVGIE